MNATPDRSVVPAGQAHAEAAKRATTFDAVMLGLLPAAAALADPPVSNFRVGAVARGVSGALYLGANLEFPGHALSASVHAEQAAIVNAWDHGEAGVVALAVTAAPCGYCRQFLNELVTADHLHVLTPHAAPVPLAALLPGAFGPRDLGKTGGLMQPGAIRLEVDPRELAPPEALATAALRAAEASYAPYSDTLSGIALAARRGGVHVGRYAENAAFNPSLSPLQAALVRLALTGVPYDAITAAVLVETAGPISQRAVTEALLATIAPGVRLTYLRAVRTDDRNGAGV
jgi:cytidine deaminase